MNTNFNLSSKNAVVTINVDVSIKHKAEEGTSEKIHSFLEELKSVVEKHSSDDIFFKSYFGNIITHKEKVQK